MSLKIDIFLAVQQICVFQSFAVSPLCFWKYYLFQLGGIERTNHSVMKRFTLWTISDFPLRKVSYFANSLPPSWMVSKLCHISSDLYLTTLYFYHEKLILNITTIPYLWHGLWKTIEINLFCRTIAKVSCTNTDDVLNLIFWGKANNWNNQHYSDHGSPVCPQTTEGQSSPWRPWNSNYWTYLRNHVGQWWLCWWWRWWWW